MREYLSIISGFLLPALQLLIIQRYITTLFGSGSRKLAGMIGWLLYYAFLVTAGFGILFPPQFLLVGNILMVFMINTVTRKESLKRRCISTLLICTVWMLVEVIVLLALEAVGTDKCVIDVAGSFISKMCMLLFSVLLGRYAKKKQYTEIPLRYFIITLLVPASSIYMMHHIFLMTALYAEYSFFSVVAGILLLLINYVIFTVYDRVGQAAELQSRNRLYEQQLDLCSHQAEEREGYYLELRRMRHDMKNHLLALKKYTQEQDWKGLEEYLNELSRDMLDYNYQIWTGNHMLDMILNQKEKEAEKQKTQMQISTEVFTTLPFSDREIISLFGNLLDNALEACEQIKEGERWIHIKMKKKNQLLYIEIVNAAKNTGIQTDENFVSKKDGVLHGYGMKNIRDIVEQYNGMFQCKSQEDRFEVVITIYG